MDPAARPVPPAPLRALVALTTVVVLAHVLVLEHTPLQFAASQSLGGRTFTTRSLHIEAPKLAAEGAPPATPTVPPRRRAAVPQGAAAATPLPTPPPAEPAAAVAAAPPTETPRDAEPAEQAAAPQPAASAPPGPVLALAAPSEAGASRPKEPSQLARSYTVPGSVRLKFNAIGQRGRMEYNALGEMLWLHDGRDYEARMELSVLFSKRTLTSTGRMTADGLAPNRFSDRFRSEQAAHFERDKGRVTFSANTPDSPLLPGAQDQLSVFVQLAAMLAGDPLNFPSGTNIAVQTIGPRAAEPWVFVMDADELLNLPGGPQATRKLVRTPRKEFDQKVEIWLAPALAWLPARIRITQPNGDFIDQQWRSTSSP